MFHVVFYHPEIPGNSGNAIRLSACTGIRLHLVEPLGFELSDAHLRRAGLDYHDLAALSVHKTLDDCLTACGSRRIFAFSARAEANYSDICYQPGDVLLFGPESVGLPTQVLDSPQVTPVRIPMMAGRRSLNLSNSAAIVVYEAWRQQHFAGA